MSFKEGLLLAANGLNVQVADDELAEYETLISRMDAALKKVSEMEGPSLMLGSACHLTSNRLSANSRLGENSQDRHSSSTKG